MSGDRTMEMEEEELAIEDCLSVEPGDIGKVPNIRKHTQAKCWKCVEETGGEFD